MSFIQDGLNLTPGNYAVLFLSERPTDPEGYADMDQRTMEAVERLPGYLGYELVRNGEDAIFISYWADKAAVEAWRNDQLHREAKTQGRSHWYYAYRSVVCPIEATSHFRR